MIRINQLKFNIGFHPSAFIEQIAKRLGCKINDIEEFKIVKKSLDARDKNDIKVVYSFDVKVKNEETVWSRCKNRKNIEISAPVQYKLPEKGNCILENRPIIIGAGPAGLFCAYYLAMYGFKPLLIEQGQCVEERQKTVQAFWDGKEKVNPLSNIQFGEGGAGTFSDGKLASGVKDANGRKTEVLKTFVQNGAGEEILYNAKPHVGTDVLFHVVRNMRNEIIRNGGEVWFDTRFVDYSTKTENGNETIESITIEQNGQRTVISCNILVLATGHSSRDTYKLLYEKHLDLKSKPFAVGVRVQHRQETINRSQYGKNYLEKYNNSLPAADYKLTYTAADGHGVYSFCMCPGGYVVNSSSEEGMLCVNGMSYSGRNGRNANSAIIVSIAPSDIDASENPLKGIEFQRDIERKAYSAGAGLIPTQLLKDFSEGKISTAFGSITPETKGNTAFSDINEVLPEFICNDLKEAFKLFGKIIEGYDDPDTILCAVESRTSSPIRICRNDNYEASVSGIYPCGEGAGYAGGITSSAIDGIKIFEQIYSKYIID